MRRLDEERNGEGMTQPTQPRWFKISEVQLTALRKGWTHTSLYDQKGILQSVWEDQMIDCAPPSTAERDKVLVKIQKIISMWNNGSPDDDEVLQELGLLEDELRTPTPPAGD